jgi:ribosomal protein L7/L12
MSEIKKPLNKENLSNSPGEGKKVEQSFETIKQMTLLEINELVEKLKTEYKVGEAVAMPQTGASTSEKPEEKGGNVSVKIVEIKETGVNKIKIYGVIKDLINELQGESINIIQAKKKAEEGDKIILTNIPREKAENVKKQLAEKKVEVEIK